MAQTVRYKNVAIIYEQTNTNPDCSVQPDNESTWGTLCRYTHEKTFNPGNRDSGIVHHGFTFDTGSDEAAIPISSVPYTINSPGIYYLAKNVFTNANAKITISASSVVLDLGGHTLQVSSTDECTFVKGTVGGPPSLTSLFRTAS